MTKSKFSYDHKCTLCPLHKGAKTVCMEGTGKTFAHAMVVGEAPGRNEDNQGRPFIGEAGKLLNAALVVAFLTENAREEVFITNVVKCRPPQNMKPTTSQIKACFQYLHREIEVVDPHAILALGNSATEALLDKSGVTSLRGRWHKLSRDRETFVMPTYHPAYVLRNGQGSEVWTQFCDDIEKFAAKVITWVGEGHPADSGFIHRREKNG